MTEAQHLPGLRGRAATIRRLERGSGSIASTALARMEETLPWFRTMPAETRAWIGLVAQAGVTSFVEWYRRHPDATVELRGEVFGVAPKELARVVTLRQTVELVRVCVEVMEHRVHEFAAPGAEADLQNAVMRFSREVAFSAAQVYAAAAEQRGAWDARLEALVVDSLVRDQVDDALSSRAAALGWASPEVVAVLVGRPPSTDGPVVVPAIHRAARTAGIDVLAGVQGDRLVVIIGGNGEADDIAGAVLREFAAGPVVLGPAVPDLLGAGRSARAALAGQRVVAAWPGAPRLVHATDLLPERALDGDPDARAHLVERVYRPLVAASGDLLVTVATYLEHGGSLEATARTQYVHANTVRYRLRRVAELTGYAAGNPRDGFALQVALTLGRLDDEREL